MVELVPLRVKIGMRQGGGASYPPFNDLPVIVDLRKADTEDDWAYYVDREGGGWLYDKSSGHGDDNAVDHGMDPLDASRSWASPKGQQWGVILVPAAFADEALAAFPGDVDELDEIACEAFYDGCIGTHLTAEIVDARAKDQVDIIEKRAALRSDKQPTADEAALLAKVLDPDDPEPGVRRNPNKTFKGMMAKRGFKVAKQRPARRA
jgi:hypothetical protein